MYTTEDKDPPCKGCICLPVCIPKVHEHVRGNVFDLIDYPSVLLENIMEECELLRNIFVVILSFGLNMKLRM